VSAAAQQETVRIAVTLGDPRGVGPEIALAAAQMYGAAAAHRLVFLGPAATAVPAGAELIATGEWRPAATAAATLVLAGAIAARAIDEAIRLALDGSVDAIVTAPIDKAALHAAGYDFPGHTEMLASRCGVDDVVMMMSAERTLLGGPLRVVLATTHIALAQVPASFSTDRLVRQTRLTERALREQWRLPHPRVALCAFNPHASDGGLFGDEEERVYRPALAMLRADGIDVTGPVPADTVFLRAGRGEFDVVIAPYHDVGMAAFKTASFGAGVNVTLGLPFPRTSPDHGTALDIAGRGVADASSMLEAIQLAERLVRVRSQQQVSS
jgi:4-hydroxythreonine-4-phosphate dehydrogenase